MKKMLSLKKLEKIARELSGKKIGWGYWQEDLEEMFESDYKIELECLMQKIPHYEDCSRWAIYDCCSRTKYGIVFDTYNGGEEEIEITDCWVKLKDHIF